MVNKLVCVCMCVCVSTVPHGVQIESLWYGNYGGRGLKLIVEPSVVPIDSDVNEDLTTLLGKS